MSESSLSFNAVPRTLFKGEMLLKYEYFVGTPKLLRITL